MLRAAAHARPGRRIRGARAAALAARRDSDITLSEHGKFWWDGAIVGHLTAGASPLAPQVSAGCRRTAEGNATRRRAERGSKPGSRRASTRGSNRCWRWPARPKPEPEATPPCPAQARGMAHQLAENFGSLDRASLGAARQAWAAAARPASPSASGSAGAPSICPSCCAPTRPACWRCSGASGPGRLRLTGAAGAGPHLLRPWR